MIRELGAVRNELDVLSGTPSEAAAEAAVLREALDHAGGAVHHCLDAEDEPAVRLAWQAIARAQDAVRGASSVIAAAREQRRSAREMRSAAARQREAARRWQRARHHGDPEDGGKP